MNHPSNKRLYQTANEVAIKEYSNDRFLWGFHFVRSALNGIVGGSDSGKSTFLRELAIAVAQGEEEFQSFPLRTQTKKVLIFSLEDGERDVNSFLNDFRHDLIATEELENIHFVFEYEGKAIDTLKKITDHEKYDLIIIDSYSDVFDGYSGNDQMETKRFLNTYDAIAKAQDAALIFLHHINKASKESKVSKDSTMGSAGFQQGVRSLVVVNKMQGKYSTLRHIVVEKGNYVSSADKRKELILNFNEETLSFEFVRLVEIKAPASKERYSKKERREILSFCVRLKKQQPNISSRKMEDAVREKFGKSPVHTTIENWLKNSRLM